jgi:hypothetical protein
MTDAELNEAVAKALGWGDYGGACTENEWGVVSGPSAGFRAYKNEWNPAEYWEHAMQAAEEFGLLHSWRTGTSLRCRDVADTLMWVAERREATNSFPEMIAIGECGPRAICLAIVALAGERNES